VFETYRPEAVVRFALLYVFTTAAEEAAEVTRACLMSVLEEERPCVRREVERAMASKLKWKGKVRS
jgi:hypothetical protein